MSKVFRITGAASLQNMIDAIDRYEPTQKQLDDIEQAMRLGPPKNPDIDYVRSVLAGKTAANTPDGELEPPHGARCRTRSGFRAWLRREESKSL